ncbi:uncharacterized protein [Manis javanica]|uniref:uncharacterized protein isoform X4 n=1 Tax=Manis javanica TaxID=9974 RepID=UPI003C6CC580
MTLQLHLLQALVQDKKNPSIILGGSSGITLQHHGPRCQPPQDNKVSCCGPVSPESFWVRRVAVRYPFIGAVTSDEALPLTLLFLWEPELLWEPPLPDPPPRAHRPFPWSLVFSPNTGLRFAYITGLPTPLQR